MSISSSKLILGAVTAVFAFTSAGAFAKDRRYDDRPGDRYGYEDRYEDRYDDRYEDRRGAYDWARVVDVQPLVTRVRVSTPQRECWDETRVDTRRHGPEARNSAGGALVGAIVGGVLGSQIGSGRGRDAATAAGAVIGAAVGHQQAERRNNGYSTPPREYTVQRCDTRYSEQWEERVDGYRVTYVYNGRRQVTEMPYRPGERIRVRVDVSPAD